MSNSFYVNNDAPGDRVVPFRASVSDAVLEDLRARLARTRWPEAQTVEDWSQGPPLEYVRELAEYWASGYDWRAREARFNRFDQFVTRIDGLDIHFIHQRSPHRDAFPLVLTHGWPGSVLEFHRVIDPLVNPTAYGKDASEAFHVVVPSLPGFGFSGKPEHAGWGVERVARAWETLMLRLGYTRYGAQGGDWGASVTAHIGQNGRHCAGIHTNMPAVIVSVPEGEVLHPSADERRALDGIDRYARSESGYSKQQSTRPQTIGYALVDSPVGQLAWIVEKFWAWTDNDGHPESAISRDEILDDVTLYWVTASGASSARLYWESFKDLESMAPSGGFVGLPTGVADFPREIIRAPRRWVEAKYNVTRWTVMPKGGHFAALEQPTLLVDDIRVFFASVR